MDSLPYVDVLPEGWKEISEKEVDQEVSSELRIRFAFVAKQRNKTLRSESVPSGWEGEEEIGKPPDTAGPDFSWGGKPKDECIASWEGAVDAAKTLIEYEHQRLMALELHRRYGGEALERRSKEEEAHLSLLERALKIRLNEADAINYERKMEQMKVGAKATSLEEEIRATDAKIRMLQRKCEALRESAEKRV